MSFWNLEETSTGEFEVGGGEIAPIPADTQCLASIDEAKWDNDRDGNSYVSLRWNVLQPAEYKNRKVFQKLWVRDDDPRAKDAGKKRDKAIRMLGAIDQNAGGKLRAAGVEPTDESLGLALVNKPMLIKVMVWKITDEVTGENKAGNWIGAVSPRSKTAAPAVAKAAPVKTEDAPF
jgi:hypothetical protein